MWVLLMSVLHPDATASLLCQYALGRRSVVKALGDFKLCDCQGTDKVGLMHFC